MLGPIYHAFIRYFYCACLTRPPDFLSRFRNLAGATKRIKIDKIENQVAPAEVAALVVSVGQNLELETVGIRTYNVFAGFLIF